MGDNFRVHRVSSVSHLLGDKLHDGRQQDRRAGEREEDLAEHKTDREILGFGPLLRGERRKLNEEKRDTE